MPNPNIQLTERDRELLREMAKAEGRSMRKQISRLINGAYLSWKSQSGLHRGDIQNVS